MENFQDQKTVNIPVKKIRPDPQKNVNRKGPDIKISAQRHKGMLSRKPLFCAFFPVSVCGVLK